MRHYNNVEYWLHHNLLRKYFWACVVLLRVGLYLGVVLLRVGLYLGVVLLRVGLYLGSEEEIGVVVGRQSPGGQIYRYKCFTGAGERQKIKSGDQLSGRKSGQSCENKHWWQNALQLSEADWLKV